VTVDYPRYSLDIVARTSEDPAAGDQVNCVQFAVVDPDGERHVYGDQSWVAFGVVIRDGSHPDGKIQQRRLTITYGDWEDLPATPA
jgi:hypothetical protein